MLMVATVVSIACGLLIGGMVAILWARVGELKERLDGHIEFATKALRSLDENDCRTSDALRNELGLEWIPGSRARWERRLKP